MTTKPPLLPTSPAGERFLRRIDWNLFRQYYEIVEAGSLSAAARRLNLRQPSLSAALKRLEEHLGVTLCRRGARGIELTPAGQAFYDIAAAMVEQARSAPHLTALAAGRIEGHLRISTISTVVCAEFDAALSSFHRRHPAVTISIEVAPWRAAIAAVSAGDCDLAVSYDQGPRPPLHYDPLFSESQQLYCGRHHPLWGQRLHEAAALAREAFILTGADEPEDLERFRLRYHLGGQVAARTADLFEACRLIELGLGVGFLPTVVAATRPAGRLWPLLAHDLPPRYQIYLITPPPGRISTPGQLFRDELRRRLHARNPER